MIRPPKYNSDCKKGDASNSGNNRSEDEIVLPKKKQLTATNKVVSSFSKLSPTATSFDYSSVSGGHNPPLQTKTTEQQKQPHAQCAPPQTANYLQEYSSNSLLQMKDSLTNTSSYINDHMGGYHQRTTAAVTALNSYMSPPALGINNVNQVQAHAQSHYQKQKSFSRATTRRNKYEQPIKQFINIKVIRCGISEMNGTYNKSTNRNGYPEYHSRGRIFLDRKPGRFILLRDVFSWYLGFQWVENEGTSKLDKTYYRADCISKSEADLPPCDGWTTIAGSGVYPAPTTIGYHHET